MKKLCRLSIFLCFILVCAQSLYADTQTTWVAKKAPYQIIINNKTFNTDKPIVTINGTTYLPLRAIGEALSVPVNWNSGEKCVEIGKPTDKPIANVSSALSKNSSNKTEYVASKAPYKIKLEGKELKTSHPIVTVDGTTYLPLRAIGEALNVPVNWNAAKKQVEIGKPKQTAPTESIAAKELSVGTWSVDRDIPLGVYDIVRITDVASVTVKDNYGKPFVSTSFRDNLTDGTTLKNVVLDKSYVVQVDAGKVKLVFKQNIVSTSVNAAAEYDHLLSDFKKFFSYYLEVYDEDYRAYARLLESPPTYELRYPTPDNKYYTASGYFYLSIGDGTKPAIQHKHTYIYKDDQWQLIRKEYMNSVVGEWRPCTDDLYCK